MSRSEGDEDGGAVAHSVGMCLVAHGLSHFMCAGDAASPGLAVIQHFLGREGQVGRVAHLGQVALDGLHLALDIFVLAPA